MFIISRVKKQFWQFFVRPSANSNEPASITDAKFNFQVDLIHFCVYINIF